MAKGLNINAAPFEPGIAGSTGSFSYVLHQPLPANTDVYSSVPTSAYSYAGYQFNSLEAQHLVTNVPVYYYGPTQYAASSSALPHQQLPWTPQLQPHPPPHPPPLMPPPLMPLPPPAVARRPAPRTPCLLDCDSNNSSSSRHRHAVRQQVLRAIPRSDPPDRTKREPPHQPLPLQQPPQRLHRPPPLVTLQPRAAPQSPALALSSAEEFPALGGQGASLPSATASDKRASTAAAPVPVSAWSYSDAIRRQPQPPPLPPQLPPALQPATNAAASPPASDSEDSADEAVRKKGQPGSDSHQSQKQKKKSRAHRRARGKRSKKKKAAASHAGKSAENPSQQPHPPAEAFNLLAEDFPDLRCPQPPPPPPALPLPPPPPAPSQPQAATPSTAAPRKSARSSRQSLLLASGLVINRAAVAASAASAAAAVTAVAPAAPLLRVGKQRERPKAKKKSLTKKIILLERQARKRAASTAAAAVVAPVVAVVSPSAADIPDDRAAYVPKDRAAEVPEDRAADVPEDRAADVPEDRAADIPEDRAADVPEDRAADVPEGRAADVLEVNAAAAPPAAPDARPPPPSVKSSSSSLHSRRFREYCDQLIVKSVQEMSAKILRDLMFYQTRARARDPAKAKQKRRLVMGLREARKHIGLNRIRLVFISPDLERVQAPGGLDDTVHQLIELCQQKSVPYVFGLKRREMGRVLKKTVPVSVVAVFDYQGCETSVNHLLELVRKAKEDYQLLSSMAAASCVPGEGGRDLQSAEAAATVATAGQLQPQHSRNPSDMSAALSEPISEELELPPANRRPPPHQPHAAYGFHSRQSSLGVVVIGQPIEEVAGSIPSIVECALAADAGEVRDDGAAKVTSWLSDA